VGDAPLYIKVWVKVTPSFKKTAISNRYLLVAQKRKMAIFSRKFGTKFLYVKTLSGKVIRHFNCLNVRKWLVWDVPFCLKFRLTPFKNAEFQSIFARSAVTLRENSLIMTNRKSTTGFPIGLI